MAKLIITALAAALVIAVSPARAFDGNDRILEVDAYQKLPANSDYDPPLLPVDFRPYGSQVMPGWPLEDALAVLVEPNYSESPNGYAVAYRPLDGTVRASSYYLRRPKPKPAYDGGSYGYRPRDYVCAARVSASPKLARPLSEEWAKGAAKKAWRKEVTARFGAGYAALSFAKSPRMDCNGGGFIRCEFSAVPCRSI